MEALKHAVVEEAGWFRHNLAKNDLRTAVSTLVFNCRWHLGYWIGPFKHACVNAEHIDWAQRAT
jgi:hypothetical protein